MKINITEKGPERVYNIDAVPVKEKSGNFKSSVMKVFRKVMLLDSHPSGAQQTQQIKFHSEIVYTISESCDLVNIILSTFHMYVLHQLELL